MKAKHVGLSFVPYGSDSGITICTLEKLFVDLKQIDDMSECFRNLCTDWNLCWNEMLYGGMKQIDLHLNFSYVDVYAVDKYLDFMPETVMNTVQTVTPDSNLINFDNVICSHLVEAHCTPLDLPKESYMYMYEVCFDTLQDYCKRSIGWPELWLHNEFPTRYTVMSKALESCIMSETEGFNVPIEVQLMYEYFTEMYDYTNFFRFTTKSFVPKLLCAVSNETMVSRDSTIVKLVPSNSVPAKQNVYKYHYYKCFKT